MLMMNPVRGHPENRAAFERHRGTNGHDVLKPEGGLISAVCQQAVVAHSNSQACRQPPHGHGHEECLPGEEEQRRHSSDMKHAHEKGGHPVDFVICSLPLLQNFELSHHGLSSGRRCNHALRKLRLAGTRECVCNSSVIPKPMPLHELTGLSGYKIEFPG